jgi:RecJ-like exonuclease
LDQEAISRVADLGADLVIFTDLGSGMLHDITSSGIHSVIADHHIPSPSATDFCNKVVQINPHLVGADGATDISGSGVAFLLAKELDAQNADLSALAVVGAVGDLQDLAMGHLVGMNREILNSGCKAEVLSFGPDLKLFGKQTRPLFKMLEYSSDPFIPSLSGNEEACISFLKELDIRLGGERWRRWIDLNQEEKAKVVSSLVRKGLRAGLSHHHLQRLVGEVYTLLREAEGTELRDASEFSTLLNATARYGHSGVGLRVCMGDRDQALQEAKALLGQHRQNLVNGLKLVKEKGLTSLDHIQYFDAGNAIPDTIVGIVAGLCFQMSDRSKPILAFALTEKGELKVSARGTSELVRTGLNLAFAISSSAKAVGGVGGGHNVAAGATIPKSAREAFLDMMDRHVGGQLSTNPQ